MVSRRKFIASAASASALGLAGCSKTASRRDAKVPPEETIFKEFKLTSDNKLRVTVADDLQMEIGSLYNGTAEIIGINVPNTGYTKYTQAFVGANKYQFQLPDPIPKKVFVLAKSKTGQKDDWMQAERVTLDLSAGEAKAVSGHEYRKNYIITD